MAVSEERAVRVLSRGFLRSHPDEAARTLESASAEEIVELLAVERDARVTQFVERLTPELAGEVLGALPDDVFRRLVPTIDPARTAALLARLEADVRRRRLACLDPWRAQEIETLMSYPAETAGRLMDPRVATCRPEQRVDEALTRLRALARRRVDDLFLVDGGGRLIGVLSLQDLALASPDAALGTLVRGTPMRVSAMAPREEVVERLTLGRLRSLGVVDTEDRLLGELRHDALVLAAQEEASADLLTMVGASAEERALSPVGFAVRKRLPWLQINLLTAFLAAAVVGLFESTIAQFTALAVLLPVVAGQSGNTGAQALAVTMRGLALREVRLAHWLRVARKELLVALVNGVAVAITTAAGVYLWSSSPGLALVIGTSMVLSMAAAGLAGAATPMALTAVGQDPAQASSIILTTVTDVVGFMSFLGIARLLSALL